MNEGFEQIIRQNLEDIAREIEVHAPERIYVEVGPDDLLDAAGRLFQKLGARYAIASGTHIENGFEVLHHFAFDGEGGLVSLRVRTEEDPPEFDSLAPMIKGARFIEREIHDLLGIRFRGHPNLTRLILPEDWPDDVYPLRQGKPWEGKVKKQI
ncbi:MAG: NADH-quinone oxidoreductase subunit C [Candidatus Brocadiia bacterium]